MRVVSVGCPLPSALVDNHSIANAPSIFDYDACVYDPRAVSEQIEGLAAGAQALRSPDGRPVQAGASGAFAFGLAELLEQRRFELQTLMDRGGVLVMFVHPNIAHPSVTSLPGLERYTLTPSPGAGALGWPALRGGDGKEIRSTAPAHPAAGYLDELSGRLRYRAVWDEQSPAFPAGAQVLARSIGGHVVGAEFRIGAGRLVMLPPPLEPLSTADRKRFTGAILELLVRLVDEDGAGREPVWVKRYDTEQTEAARAALAAAEAGLREAERRTTESRGALAEVARFSELLWRPAGAKLTALVEDAMRTLGFEVKTGTSGPELTDSDAIALLEVEASDQEVSERVYLTLQRRLEEHFLRRKARPKGIIVVSGQRDLDPKFRKKAWTQPLVNACETFNYALIPVAALYELVNFAVDDPDPEGLADLRASILETAGLLEVEAPEEEPDPVVDPPSATVIENGRTATPVAEEPETASESS